MSTKETEGKAGTNGDPREEGSRARKAALAALLVLALAALLALLFAARGCSEEEPAGAGKSARAAAVPAEEPAPADSASAPDADSLARAGESGPEAAADSSARALAASAASAAESGAKTGPGGGRPGAASAKSGSRGPAEPGPASASAAPGSAKPEPEAVPAAPADTVAPELLFGPPDGRFYGQVESRAACEEPGCRLYTSVGDSLSFEETAARTLVVPGGPVWAYAVDSAGNRSEIQRRDYVVLPGTPQCGSNAVPVGEGADGFCMDQYEWPNRPGERPMGSVSHDAAADSCASVGKTLCTMEQWTKACRGPEGNAYPYGKRYRQKNCYTSVTAVGRSGRRSNCRSWYGVYDMSGNLWEWTSTPASRPGRFLAAGGSWGAGDLSGCSESKWSFFPQNEYPIVGFRCCAPSGAGSR